MLLPIIYRGNTKTLAEHLKASNLVAKLDGKRMLNKGKKMITQSVIPYPAIVEHGAWGAKLRFIDFPHLTVEGANIDEVTSRGRDMLLRELVNLVKESKKAPSPTPPLEYADEAHVMLIDPL